MGTLEDALKQFMASNPDIPEGKEMEQHAAKPKVTHKDKLQVIVERKGRAGKTATIITGFTCSDAEVDEIARKLKTRLGTGGSARGGEILIQGNRRDDVIAALQAMEAIKC